MHTAVAGPCRCLGEVPTCMLLYWVRVAETLTHATVQYECECVYSISEDSGVVIASSRDRVTYRRPMGRGRRLGLGLSLESLRKTRKFSLITSECSIAIRSISFSAQRIL